MRESTCCPGGSMKFIGKTRSPMRGPSMSWMSMHTRMAPTHRHGRRRKNRRSPLVSIAIIGTQRTSASRARSIRTGPLLSSPTRRIPFRIPRMRAHGEHDLSQALRSASPSGVRALPENPISRPRWATPMPTAFSGASGWDLASRWVAPVPANPNYLALKLFTNYDGLHHEFATTSVSDTNDGNPNLIQQLRCAQSSRNR